MIFGKPDSKYSVSTRMISRSTITEATVAVADNNPLAAPLPRVCTMLEFWIALRMPNREFRSEMVSLFCRSLIRVGTDAAKEPTSLTIGGMIA